MEKDTQDNHPLSKFQFCPVCGSAQFLINSEKSKRCAACGFEYFHNPSSAVVAAILNEKGELLVCRRAKEPAMGTLDLPGGFCDLGETGEEGLAREVREETGLEVDTATFLFTLPNNYLYSNFHVHTIDMFFRCTVKPGIQPKAMDDAAELMWMPLDQLQPEAFGLGSIREGVRTMILKKMLNK